MERLEDLAVKDAGAILISERLNPDKLRMRKKKGRQEVRLFVAPYAESAQ